MIWKLFAFILSRGPVFDWVRERALATPYTHIGPPAAPYMRRFWVFNPYGKDAAGNVTPPRWPALPSARLHHICREDVDDHMHDHPWSVARTIVCEGWYNEEKAWQGAARWCEQDRAFSFTRVAADGVRAIYRRNRGFTGALRLGEYHRISEVSLGGVWTFFITWGPSHGWGFKVDGEKVPWRDYLTQHPDRK